jgi:hypothetical protein
MKHMIKSIRILKLPIYTLIVCILLSYTSSGFCEKTSSYCSNKNRIIFPRAFAFAIDDLGWNTGTNSGEGGNQGPYRIGIDRKMDIDDYKCIVEVAKQVGVRIQGLFVLAEMDRENILAKYPTTTWMGKNWDNGANRCQENIDIMNFVRDNSAYLEFGLHGVGHEYWVNGVKKRAEWYCTDDNHPWPKESSVEHLQCFKDILAQYKLSPEYGHSFPESFVPCAYGYYWNPTGEYSTGSIMSKAGVKYVNTLFDYIRELNPPIEPNGGGFDQGVIVVNRRNYGNDWYRMDALPTIDISQQESDIIESHWSNWLAQDGFLQAATNQKWIDYYKMVQSVPDRYIAKNTQQFFSQWLYKKYTKVSENNTGTVIIDNTQMPDEAYKHDILGNMVLKIKLDSNQHISRAKLNDENMACYFEDQGYGFIYLPMLEKRIYTLEYEVGSNKPESYIFNKGTYSVYSYQLKQNSINTSVRIYGTQEVDFYGLKQPSDIKISNQTIKVLSTEYNKDEKHLVLTLNALDFQGVTCMISMQF